MRATTPTIALFLVFVLCGCAGGGSHDQRPAAALIAKARQAEKFAYFAEIFPERAGERRCSVRAGAPGTIFRGVCSASVHRGGEASTVEFTQEFGREGVYTWVVLVPRSGDAFVVRRSGRGLVQAIP